MKLEYIVRCKYYGIEKVYNKVFYSEREYNNFKEWIKNKKGYTNVNFLKKLVETKTFEYKKQPVDKTKKEGLKYYLINNKKPILFYKFIYCLINNNEIVYVGKSINIQNRIIQHQKENTKEFDSFAIISKLPSEITDDELLRQEEKYIKLLKPKYNVMHNING